MRNFEPLRVRRSDERWRRFSCSLAIQRASLNNTLERVCFGLELFPHHKIAKDLDQLRTVSPGGSKHEHAVFVDNMRTFPARRIEKV